MNDIDRTPRQLTAGLVDLAGTSAPDYRNDTLRQVARTPQRPAWTFPERWIPMALLTQSGARVRPMRQTWQLLVVLAVTLALVAGLAVVGARLMLPAPPNQGFNSLVTVPTLELAETWDASAIPGFEYPSGMDLGPDGSIYVVNAGASEIVVLRPDGSVLERWGSKGTGPGQFDFQTDPQDKAYTIGGVAVGPDGSAYVVDSVNDRVQQFDAERRFVRQWGEFGTGDGKFLSPIDADVDDEGSVYVVDQQRNDFQRFSADGVYEQTTAVDMSGAGHNTGAVFVGSDGTVYNADYGSNRVQAFGPDGAFLWSMGAGSGPVTFRSPGDVGLDKHGNLYVSDLDGLRIFDHDRALVGSWSPPESDLNADWFPFVVSPDGWVYVGSQTSSLIYKLRIGTTEVAASDTPAPVASTGPTATVKVGSAQPSQPSGTGSIPTVIDHTFPLPFTVDLPPGWTLDQVKRGLVEFVKHASPNNLAFVHILLPLNAYADPCRTENGPISPPVGPSVQDLTDALTDLVGFNVGPVTDISVDGYRGTTFDLEQSIDITACSASPWLPQMTYDASTTGGLQASDIGVHEGVHQRVAILDVDGARVVIQTWTYTHSSIVDIEEAFRLLESIDFH